ncbi:MAG: PD-(D/E)XK nuclease-like domain-containing protein [Buttiauxella sp.]
MMYAYLIKSRKNSGKPNLFVWLESKSDSRADREVMNILEDAEIETGRGADHQLPVRTDLPVFDDLPEEGVLDNTWCDRYELAEDAKTWQKIITEASGTSSSIKKSTTTTLPKTSGENLRPVTRLRLPQRLIAHLIYDDELTEISEAQHIEIGEAESDENNIYVCNLLKSITNVPGISELSAHVEWSLIDAFKRVFPQAEFHLATALPAFTEFMTAWVAAEPKERAFVTREWIYEKVPSLQNLPVVEKLSNDSKVPSREQVSERLAEMRNLSDDDIIDSSKLPFPTQIAHFWLGGMYTATPNERKAATAAAMDTDNSYLQNVILAFNTVEPCKHCYDHIRQSLIEIIQRIWPVDGKAPELNLVLTFTKEWMTAINDSSDSDGVKRKAITEKWLTKYRKERTPTGATAGGLNKTDRNPDLIHTLDTLDEEIACALLPMDFDIYNIPGSIHRRAKEMVAAKESPWKEWSRKLRHCPGILDYSRAAIFALIRSAAPNVHMMPGTHQAWINAKLTESNHANPDAETVAEAMGSTAPMTTFESSNDAVSDTITDETVSTSNEPDIKSLGSGVFSIEGLIGDQSDNTADIKAPLNEVVKEEEVKLTETTSNEQMETIVSNEITSRAEIPASESVAADGEEIIAVEQSANEFPAYFEPGRYESLPNDVYHGANGISSTQVKDARVSLMYFQGRHITKTIGRETSEAFTFGTLVHALALEPETLDTDFAVFPGIPEGAFTNTDSLKTFIREYNEGKDKSEQLKLTGTKDVLSAAIRTVKPDAIFADEFEQQWNEANQDKIILSERQLAHAKAIQQALFNHPSAGQLLQHPNRANEVSYFGMDEETGLEVRVRPDLEIDMSGVRIGTDLKTISLGKVKQDFLRAKLHREIIERDYHLSAAMYCDVADFNQFFWIFVNKDEGYHWVAIIEASEELLELGRLEYRKAMNAISNALDTNLWPAPITEDYTDELNDFDMRRLEALRLA